jgi:hypothetical protein
MKQKLVPFLKKTATVLSLAVLVNLIMNWFFTPLSEDMQVLVFIIIVSLVISVAVYQKKT